jgi:hypothetical protein
VCVAIVTASCTDGSGRRGEETSSTFSLQPTASSGDGQRPWFAASAAFWEPIAPDPAIASSNDEVRSLLADPDANMVANLVSFAVPIVDTDSAAAPLTLTIREEGHDGWGFNELSKIRSVKVPSGTSPAPGTDGKVVVIDRPNNQVIDLLAVEVSNGGWSAKWGGVYALDGDGTSRFPTYQGPNAQTYPRPVSRGTGSGISSLAGLVTVDDVASGSIDHALVFATDRACGPPFDGPFWPPATTTDGWVEGAPCIPEGGRLQLDPAIDVNALGLDPGLSMIARALQVHGAICIDNGGSRVGLIFELAQDAADEAVYVQAGLVGDYVSLNALPWGNVRLLAAP